MPITASASDILTAATQELGLPSVSLSASSRDAIGYQSLGLMNALGDELVRVQDWQFLEKVMTFVGDGVTSVFPLPDDWGRQINQTQWATSDNRPLRGPDSPQMWSWNKYGIVSVGVFFRYRILNNEYNIFPTPGDGDEFALYYISKNWVYDTDTEEYKDKISKSTDVPVFDRRVMTSGLKAKLWSIKGFDTTLLQQEYDRILDDEKGQGQGARAISLCGGDGHLYLNYNNVPDSGYGT